MPTIRKVDVLKYIDAVKDAILIERELCAQEDEDRGLHILAAFTRSSSHSAYKGLNDELDRASRMFEAIGPESVGEEDATDVGGTAAPREG